RPPPPPLSTLSLHDALPILTPARPRWPRLPGSRGNGVRSTEAEVMGSGTGTHDLILPGAEPIASGRVVCPDPKARGRRRRPTGRDRKSTRLNSSHVKISYAV